MEIVKWIIYLMIFGVSTTIGVLLSKRYEKRVNELVDFKRAFIILKTKIRYTYLPLKDLFENIINCTNDKTREVFKKAFQYLDSENSTDSWSKAVETTILEITNEDKKIIIRTRKNAWKN